MYFFFFLFSLILLAETGLLKHVCYVHMALMKMLVEQKRRQIEYTVWVDIYNFWSAYYVYVTIFETVYDTPQGTANRHTTTTTYRKQILFEPTAQPCSCCLFVCLWHIKTHRIVRLDVDYVTHKHKHTHKRTNDFTWGGLHSTSQ